MPNAQGKLETMKRDTWVWLIGMTDAGDDELRQWAESFAHPPRLKPRAPRPAAEPYAPERRALCLTVENNSVTITITPAGHCVNPVFELKDAPKTLLAVRLNDQPLIGGPISLGRRNTLAQRQPRPTGDAGIGVRRSVDRILA